MFVGEAALGLEDGAPQLVEVALLRLLLRGRLDVGGLVYGIVLAALDWVRENLSRLLDALEEVVVLGAAGGGFLVWMMAEDLLAVGALDLLLSSLPAVLGDT